MLEYDDVVNKQREVIYDQRRKILTEPTLRPTVERMIEHQIAAHVQTFAGERFAEDWDLEALHAAISRMMPLPSGETPAAWQGWHVDELRQHLNELARQAYSAKEQRLGKETMRQIERLLMLQVVDHRWVRHLTDLDILREGIGLQAVAQQDPLVAYKRAAYDMFTELLASIEEDIANRIYLVEMVQQQQRRPMRAVHASAGGGDSRPEPQRRTRASSGPQ